MSNQPSRPPDTSPLPPSHFGTPSPLVATHLSLAAPLRVKYMHYDAGRRLFVFWQVRDGDAQRIIDDFNSVDPLVHIRRFHRRYQEMLSEKMSHDARFREAVKADPRLSRAVALGMNREASTVVPREK